MSQIERYSSRYYILDETDILPYSGEHVAVDGDLYEYLRQYVKSPIFKLNGGHYSVHEEWGIPPHTVAVPAEWGVSDQDHVLVAKNREAFDIIMGNGLSGGGGSEDA